jgi:hypothetical protein
VDHNAVHVGDDKKRRILQGILVEQELIESSVQVLSLALVLPTEESPFPDIGPTVAATMFRGSLLEGELCAGRVDRRRLWMVEDLAKIQKVLLRR